MYLLERVNNLAEVHAIVTSVPKDLEDLYVNICSGELVADDFRYGNVIHHMKTGLEHLDRVNAFRILHGLCVCERPLTQQELLDAVSFANPDAISNKEYRLWDSTIDLCKPIIEVTASGVVKFVHFTVKACV